MADVNVQAIGGSVIRPTATENPINAIATNGAVVSISVTDSDVNVTAIANDIGVTAASGSTVSVSAATGVSFVEVTIGDATSGSGTTNHASLGNLAYADSGHTGFAATTDLTDYVATSSSDWVELTGGGNTTLHSHVGAGAFYASYALLQDQQASGTEGGNFPSSSWVTRTINTEVLDADNIVSLTTDSEMVFTSGDYHMEASAPALNVTEHRIALNKNGSTDQLAYGVSSRMGSASGTVTRSTLVHDFTAASTDIYTIQHWCNTTRNTDGLGSATGIAGAAEIFTEVKIWKYP